MALFKMADSFPIETGDTGKDVKSLRSYVYQMQETLRYVLGNLGGENFNEADLGNITEPIYARIEDAESASAELSVAAQGIKAQVTAQGQSITSLQVTASGLTTRVASVEGQYSQISQTINGLEITTDGNTTYISGDSIKTGTIVGADLVAYGDVDGDLSYGLLIYDSDPEDDGNYIGAVGYQWLPEDDAQFGDKLYIVTESYKTDGTRYWPCIKILAAGRLSLEADGGIVYMRSDEGISISDGEALWEFRSGHLYRDDIEVI